MFDGLSRRGDDAGVQISQFSIADAIRSVHPAGDSHLQEHNAISTDACTPSDPIQKTKFWQFGGIFEDEGTFSGTYRVHDSIFIAQLGLKASQIPSDLRNDFFRTALARPW